ncbi:MAG: TRAP transporter substrate-binding protein DctP [Anaerovoracaceae bacterium]
MKTVNGKKWLSILLAAVMVLALLAGCGGEGATEAESVTWRIQSSYPPGDQCWDVQMPMICERLTEATDGYLQFELYQPGAICEPDETPTMLSKGLLDAALTAPNHTAGLIPAAYAEQGVPFLWQDGQDVYDTYYDYGLLDFVRDEYAKADIYYGMYVPNGAYMIMTNFPVTTASDFVGKKLRASTTFGMFIEQLGGLPVVMSGGDIYMGMRLGTIDGNIYTVCELETSKLMEVTKYLIEPAVGGSAPVNLSISMKSWNALPDDIKDIVNETMQDMFMDIYEASISFDKSAIKAGVEYGTKINTIPEENLQPFYDAAAAVIEKCKKEYPAAAPGYDIIERWQADNK